MGGCTDCSSKGGCDVRKGSQREILDDVVARIYPDRTWGRPDDEARFRAGVERGEVRRMGSAIASLLKAPTFFRAGADEDLCDFVWVLCVGREPALVDVRDGYARSELVPGRVDEKYLRVCFSSLARIAAVQEVTLTLDTPDADPAGADVGLPADDVLIREAPRPGVYDPILIKRMQKLVAFLEASDISHIDFGLLDKPLVNGIPGDYVERYGVEPRLANFLFYARPPTTATSVMLAL